MGKKKKPKPNKSSGSCFAMLGKAGSDPVWLCQQNTGLHLSHSGKCLFCGISCRIRNNFPAIMHRSGIYRKVELIHERWWEGDLHNQGTRHFSIINVLNGQICFILTERPGKKITLLFLFLFFFFFNQLHLICHGSSLRSCLVIGN